jgi:lipopolysaccharide export system protein LptA
MPLTINLMKLRKMILSLKSLLIGLSLSLICGVALAEDEPAPDLGAFARKLQDLEPETDQVDEFEAIGLNLGRQFLYDARTIGFGKDGQTYMFKGDVVLIGAGNLITADMIEVHYDEKLLIARGHVIMLTSGQVFTGEQIKVWWESGDFQISEAVMTVNSPAKVKKVTREILGMTQAEIAFRQDKAQRLQEVARRKRDLRLQYQESADLGQDPPDAILEEYTLLLEQEALLQHASVPSLSSKGEEGRKRYLKRRRYWEESREAKSASALGKAYYFQLEGQLVWREQENNYRAKDAMWTPCRCEDEEDPAWSFRADAIHAQEEGYIDLFHPVLFIKGLPVLYIPYLKVPFKTQRQSGFLMPGFQTGDQKNGFVYTQPVYFAFDENYDATFTTDVFQKRGTRLGLEFRYEAREHSGFEINMETIRDRAWLEKRSDRKELLDYYLNDANYCGQGDDLDPQCVASVQENLAVPSNTWRGKQEWQGRYFLTPRWSLVSDGTFVSDHRYVEDLYLPEDYVAAFSTRAQANAFTTAKGRLTYDGSNQFVGVGSYFGDNVLLNDQFKGQQLPLTFNYQTRKYALDPNGWLPVPLYASASAESYVIREQTGSQNPTKDNLISLGDGQWQRAAVDLISPLVRESVVRVDYFADADARQISHDGLSEAQSSIRSWRTGLTVNLPIDGMGALPPVMQATDYRSDPAVGTRYLHHIMNWALTYSARPVVIRRGPYGLEDRNGAALYYFASDRDFLTSSDTRDVTNEDTMVPHQRITFSTQHRWKTFKRYWNVQYGEREEREELKEKIHNLHEQARRELLFSLDRQVSGYNEMFSENPETSDVMWHINRYQLTDADHYEPINLSASLTFDLEQEKRRQDQIEQNQKLEAQAEQVSGERAEQLRSQIVPYPNLPESWFGPYLNLGLNWGGYRLNSRLVYNVYKKASTSVIFDLDLPPFYGTSVGFGYVFEKSPGLDPDTNDLIFRRTRTQSLGLSTNLIPMVSTGINLVQKEVEGQDRRQYGTSINLAYTDPSGCWGVRFVREKDLNQNEENANYILQLSIIFLGNRRSGDLSPALEREIPRFTFSR